MLHVKPEQLHQPNSGNDLVGVRVEADDSISTAHHDLPDNVLGSITHLKESVLRYFAIIDPRFIVQELPYSHLQLLNGPRPHNIPKIFPKEHAHKPPLLINDTRPQRPITLIKQMKSISKGQTRCDSFWSQRWIILKQWSDFNCLIDFTIRLIGHSQQEQKDVFEVDDWDKHARVDVFDDDTVDLLQNHRQDDWF